ncbi:MAG: HAD-IC family P-type ATPase, partial [Sulfuricellaceae bacterium]|nr:HAD-IC family P-type ATPase [Sulfuricellaceae bacterium]
MDNGDSGLADTLGGLSAAEAARLLAQYGANEVAEEKPHPLLALLRKFWSPVPWMLELTIVLQLALGKADEAAVIAVLLVVNAVLSFLQEGRANKALALLRQRLDIQARVRRDGRWQLVPARNLVPGDAVHLRMGDLIPADLRLAEGQVQLDQSSLTGESLPVEAGPGADAYSGSVVTRGEASGEVTATGTRTRFGKTAELVRSAKTVSHLEAVIFGIVKYLVILDIALVAALLVYAVATGMPLTEVIPFALILLVASVPVALPATFTLATALGALELAKRGVLVTRLSAIEEAAAMDVLASDKTGTITENRLTLAALKPATGIAENDLLRWAALACDEATQDPIDLAILAAAHARLLLQDPPRRISFTPFNPQTRRSETLFEENGLARRAVKGAPAEIAA